MDHVNSDFALKIKNKYPEYGGIENGVLVKKITSEYPEYNPYLDSLYKEGVGQDIEELSSKSSDLHSKIYDKEGRKIYYGRWRLFLIKVFIVIFSIVFVGRYLFYGMKWSIRVLKSKEVI